MESNVFLDDKINGRLCLNCGASIAHLRSDAVYCGATCRQQAARLARANQVGRGCSVCGVILKSSRAVYCGPQCKQKAYRQRRNEANRRRRGKQ